MEAGLSIESSELQGRFGPATEAAVREFQRRRGLVADGLVGLDTWGRLVEAGYRLGDRTLYLRDPSFRGDDVLELQRRLNALGFDAGKQDGLFGARTSEAVREFQINVGGEGDGLVGPDTVSALGRLGPASAGPSRAIVREEEALRQMDSSIVGAVVAIDPGHGPSDPGNVGPGGTVEAEITLLIAGALAEELAARGAIPKPLRGNADDPTTIVRARLANDLGATVCVSLHTNGGDAQAEGTTCFYFGTPSTHSPAGRRLAEVIQGQLVSRLGLKDRGTHPLTIDILRETRMPAVQVEPCFLTNEKEERMLADERARRDIASAIVDGIERFFRAAPEGSSATTEGYS
jgi:N-acetylmuramoyl-L-alanine amidase